MNDPNAPLFYKGYYHLFYQYNPKSAFWGRIIWGHAVSRDLINWVHMAGAAIYPDEWYDVNGAWSGSATFLHKGSAPMILYTGSNNVSEQVQAMAVPKDPSDPLLREWKKIPQNPIMLPTGINASSFRDPTTAWLGSDQIWRVLVGSKRDKNKEGMALMFRSKDFVKWVKAKRPLHSAKHTGMWECPDFYPVSLYGSNGLDTSTTGSSVKHVLKNSLDDSKVDYYTVGHYLPELDRYVPDNGSVEAPNGLRYDYGKFYASKTFFDDNKSRRILWGWINESDSMVDDFKKGWASVQAIPRVVRLDPITRRSLVQWPVPELESLRAYNVKKDNVVLERKSVMKVEGFKSGAAQVDVEVEFELGGHHEKVEELEGMTAQSLCSRSKTRGFGLMVLASDDLKERSAVFFKVFKGRVNGNVERKVALCVDQSRSTLQSDVDKTGYGEFVRVKSKKRSLSLRVLVDHSIVESFAEGGRTCITWRSYPSVAVNENAHLFVFNYNNSPLVLRRLSAWHMNTAKQVYESNGIMT
jgi:beta-fructofuranosidase